MANNNKWVRRHTEQRPTDWFHIALVYYDSTTLPDTYINGVKNSGETVEWFGTYVKNLGKLVVGKSETGMHIFI